MMQGLYGKLVDLGVWVIVRDRGGDPVSCRSKIDVMQGVGQNSLRPRVG